jgi:hypothetical protein
MNFAAGLGMRAGRLFILLLMRRQPYGAAWRRALAPQPPGRNLGVSGGKTKRNAGAWLMALLAGGPGHGAGLRRMGRAGTTGRRMAMEETRPADFSASWIGPGRGLHFGRCGGGVLVFPETL